MKKKTVAVLLLLTVAAAFLWQICYRRLCLETVYPVKYRQYVESSAGRYGVSPSLVYSVIKNESGFNPSARSKIGAVGLMQLTPDTFLWAQTKQPNGETYKGDALYSPEVNIRYGTVVLSQLLQEFGDQFTALAAYHAGRGNVKKWLADRRYSDDGRKLKYIPFDDTRAYVRKVADARAVYQKLYGLV